MEEATNRLRNRVVERRRMLASELVPHPSNPRRHPEGQVDALTGLVERVGQVGELYAYYSERAGGALVLVDGHLRREQFGADEWDVAICDLTDDEADLVLALRDHTASLATFDKATLADLMRGLNTGNDARIDKALSELAEEHGLLDGIFEAGEVDAPLLPDGDKAPFQQMTFTLHDSQADIVKEALEAAKACGPFEDSQNENSNGNALMRIAEAYLGAS